MPNQPTKFRTKNCVEIYNVSHGMYNTNSQIRIKMAMLRSRLCHYNDAYILASGTITITGARKDDATRRLEGRNKRAIFKYCASFTDRIS